MHQKTFRWKEKATISLFSFSTAVHVFAFPNLGSVADYGKRSQLTCLSALASLLLLSHLSLASMFTCSFTVIKSSGFELLPED